MGHRTTNNKDYLEWDVVNWSKALDFWQKHSKLDSEPFQCLELGGRRALWLAMKGHNVICSDFHNPEKEALAVHSKYKVKGTIKYEAIDATNIPYKNYFDVICFKSILGGISRGGNKSLNSLVVEQIFEGLKPGGKLLFAENLKASFVHEFLRKRMVKWGSSWNYLDLEDIPGLFGGFEEIKFSTAGFFGAFGRTEAQRRFLGSIDSAVSDRIFPKNFRYVVFGVATKTNNK